MGSEDYDAASGGWFAVQRLWGLVARDQRRSLGYLVVLTVLSALGEVATIGAIIPFLSVLSGSPSTSGSRWMNHAISLVAAAPGSGNLLSSTMLLCAGVLIASIFRVALLRRTQLLAAEFAHGLLLEVQRRIFLQPYSWHTSHNSSDQLATVERVEALAGGVFLAAVQSITAMMLMGVILATLLIVSPFITLVSASILALGYFGIGTLARARLHSISKSVDAAFASRIKILQEGSGGIRDVIIDGAQAQVLERLRRANSKLTQARADASFLSSVPRYLIEPMTIVLLALLAYVLWRHGTESGSILPALGAVAVGAQRMLPLIQQLYQAWSNMAANRAVADTVLRQLALPVSATVEQRERLPFSKSIRFDKVCYTYPRRTSPALKDISFEVRCGSRVGFVGPTGSGKSTTADLLMGLLEPSSGAILVDSLALTTANLPAWRANVAHVPQSLFLLDDSIARNIANAHELDAQRVVESASVAQLHDFILTLPQGYDTRVGERGVALSGGQRQRLAIARAIYKNAPLLVLDEATSALDSDTEKAVLGALDELQRRGATIVIIAHRQSATRGCDQSFRFENGQIVACAGGD